VHRGLHRKVK